MSENRVKICRENLMLSKAELARRAGLSALTIDRVEAGRPCRMDTKRRILRALGIEVGEHQSVFGRSVNPISPSSSRPMGMTAVGPSGHDSAPSDGTVSDSRRSQ